MAGKASAKKAPAVTAGNMYVCRNEAVTVERKRVSYDSNSCSKEALTGCGGESWVKAWLQCRLSSKES